MGRTVEQVLLELTGDMRELKGTVESLRLQAVDQWAQIKEIQENNIRHATILDRVVRDQRELATGLQSVAAGLSEYKSDRKVFSAFKWLAGFGGAAGLLGGFTAAMKSLFADRIGG